MPTPCGTIPGSLRRLKRPRLPGNRWRPSARRRRLWEAAGLLAGRKATNHPSCTADLPSATYSEARVVLDDRIITSRAAGTAMEFAFELVRVLFGDEKVKEVNAGVLAKL